MQTKAMSNWAGLFSIIWMLGVSVLVLLFFVPLFMSRHVIGPFWVWIFGSVIVQLVPGLILAIAGLLWGNRTGRISAIFAAGLFLWFVLIWVFPVVLRVCSQLSK